MQTLFWKTSRKRGRPRIVGATGGCPSTEHRAVAAGRALVECGLTLTPGGRLPGVGSAVPFCIRPSWHTGQRTTGFVHRFVELRPPPGYTELGGACSLLPRSPLREAPPPSVRYTFSLALPPDLGKSRGPAEHVCCIPGRTNARYSSSKRPQTGVLDATVLSGCSPCGISRGRR